MLEEILNKYKEITEKIIVELNFDAEVDSLMKDRSEIIYNIDIYDEIDKKRFKNLYISMGLLELDKVLKREIENEQNKIKEEIKKLHLRKSANTAYDKNIKRKSFFNIKI